MTFALLVLGLLSWSELGISWKLGDSESRLSALGKLVEFPINAESLSSSLRLGVSALFSCFESTATELDSDVEFDCLRFREEHDFLVILVFVSVKNSLTIRLAVFLL